MVRISRKTIFLATVAGAGFLFGAISGAIASEMISEITSEMPSETAAQKDSQRIEQPLSHRIGVTVAGLGLISLELWWFLMSRPKSQKVALQDQGIQEITIAVDGGYEPSRIVVQTGKPVRLQFLRRDPSECLAQVLIPDFRIAIDLPLNQLTTVEFTPEHPGSYAFTCGMNMFRGVIEAESLENLSQPNQSSQQPRSLVHEG